MQYKVIFNWADGSLTGEAGDYAAFKAMEAAAFNKEVIGLNLGDGKMALVNTAQCVVVLFERIS